MPEDTEGLGIEVESDDEFYDAENETWEEAYDHKEEYKELVCPRTYAYFFIFRKCKKYCTRDETPRCVPVRERALCRVFFCFLKCGRGRNCTETGV
jgi:hypothetical protein